jgi:very-short-patch-repair endonuclease
MPSRKNVLVAILKEPQDFEIAKEQHWYRIPVTSVEKWLKDRWPPEWVAFYQPKPFGSGAYSVRYFAKVIEIRRSFRWELFPSLPRDRKSERLYFQLVIAPLEKLPKPILSHRRRRIVFIQTSWEKLIAASEINDLHEGSPLEDRLWSELKRLRIAAERQEFIKANGRNYALDFAIYCMNGKLDIETDGDAWHSSPERIAHDNLRDNDMVTAGWKRLRFNSLQLKEEMAAYCVPTILKNVAILGGVADRPILPDEKRPASGQSSQPN